MKSKVTLLIILISIILLIYIGNNGIKIGNIEILSVSQLMEKNQHLEDEIKEAISLTTTEYPKNIQILEETYESCQIQKQKYEELSGTNSESNKNVYETKQYDIGYLWRILGNYATKRTVNLGISVQKNINTNSSYNIEFTLNGKYVNISQFIADIENDSDLYFRIYNFEMHGKGETITATFTVRNVNLDASTIS